MPDFIHDSENNAQESIWESIGQLDDLFSHHLKGTDASNELRSILATKFHIHSCTLFSYDLESKKLYDLLQQAPIEFNIQTPFLANLDDFLKSGGAQIFHSDLQDMSWVYTRIQEDRVMILVLEERMELPTEKIYQLKGILKIWYMRVQILISEARRKRLLNQISQFRDIGLTLAGTHRLEEVLIKILHTAIDLVDAEKGHIMVYEETTGDLQVKVAKGFGTPETDRLINEGKIRLEGLKVGEGIQGKVFATRRAMHFSEKNPLLGSTVLDHLSVICVPLAMNDEAFGVLHITNKKDFAPFEESDLDIINILATNVAAVLNKHKLFKRSSQDHLTGLANRAYFEEKAQSELNRCRRYKHPFSLMILDVDFFKKVNDTWGHLIGDEVLKMVATRLKNSLRNDIDLSARYGGEEFVILLPETEEQNAMVVAERVRTAIESNVMIRGEEEIRVTISSGITQARDTDESLEQVYERADLALYHSKSNGRNQANIFVAETMSEIKPK